MISFSRTPLTVRLNSCMLRIIVTTKVTVMAMMAMATARFTVIFLFIASSHFPCAGAETAVQPHGGPRYGRELTAAPLRVVSKCRWLPVLLPVLPTYPMSWPCVT